MLANLQDPVVSKQKGAGRATGGGPAGDPSVPPGWDCRPGRDLINYIIYACLLILFRRIYFKFKKTMSEHIPRCNLF